jgi:hypothetical protein
MAGVASELSDRRTVLRAFLSLGGVILGASRLQAEEFASAEAALEAMETRSATVEAMLAGLRSDSAAFGKAAASFLADLRRHRQDRARVRRALGLLPAAVETLSPKVSTLTDLRAAEQALVFGHTEGLPALGNSRAVAVLVPDLLDVARHLAVIDLWIEEESDRG